MQVREPAACAVRFPTSAARTTRSSVCAGLSLSQFRAAPAGLVGGAGRLQHDALVPVRRAPRRERLDGGRIRDEAACDLPGCGHRTRECRPARLGRASRSRSSPSTCEAIEEAGGERHRRGQAVHVEAAAESPHRRLEAASGRPRGSSTIARRRARSGGPATQRATATISGTAAAHVVQLAREDAHLVAVAVDLDARAVDLVPRRRRTRDAPMRRRRHRSSARASAGRAGAPRDGSARGRLRPPSSAAYATGAVSPASMTARRTRRRRSVALRARSPRRAALRARPDEARRRRAGEESSAPTAWRGRRACRACRLRSPAGARAAPAGDRCLEDIVDLAERQSRRRRRRRPRRLRRLPHPRPIRP